MARPAYERVGAAFRNAYQAAGLRQEDVADALGVDQPTVSRWARGLQRIDIEYFPLIDEMCGRHRGYVLEKAGLVDPKPGDVLAAIEHDPHLDEVGRRVVAKIYGEFVNPEASSESTRDKRPSTSLKASH